MHVACMASEAGPRSGADSLGTWPRVTAVHPRATGHATLATHVPPPRRPRRTPASAQGSGSGRAAAREPGPLQMPAPAHTRAHGTKGWELYMLHAKH